MPRFPLLEVLRRTVRVLRDSERTEDIIAVEEIIAQPRLRALLASGIFERTDEGRALLADRPLLVDTDLDALRELDVSTLGGAFVHFLDSHGLDYGLTDQPTPFTADPDAQYLLHRLRQSHDLWHTLIGVGTRGHEEVLVHAFSLAQTGIPSSAMIVGLGGIKHMIFERRWRQAHPGLWRAYQTGKRAAPLLAVYWERHWQQPLAAVRDRFGIAPLAN